jgi:hypothetical protein
MLTHRPTRARPLIGVALAFLLMAAGLWTVPAVAGAANPTNDGAFYVSINVPLNEIEEGQYCVAYANVYNGTAPYTYAWSGSYFWGSTQVVDAYMWGEDGYVELEVTDAASRFDEDLVWLNVNSSNDYNSDCEA